MEAGEPAEQVAEGDQERPHRLFGRQRSCGDEFLGTGTGQPGPVPVRPGPPGPAGVRAMLQDDRSSLRPSPAELGVIAMVQGGPCRVEGLGQARQCPPVPGRAPRDAGRPVTPQADRADGDNGGGLALAYLTPAIPATPDRESPGLAISGPPRSLPGRRGGVHAGPPGAAGLVSISTRQAWTWAIDELSFAASSRPDRWI